MGILSGLYPALILSAFNPVRVLKGARSTGSSGKGIRRFLVIGQFTATIVLMVAAVVVHRQLDYINTLDAGVGNRAAAVNPAETLRSEDS